MGYPERRRAAADGSPVERFWGGQPGTARVLAATVLAAVLGAALAGGSARGASSVSAARALAAAGQKGLTLYSVGVAEQFLNHSDDRARGEGNNPFGIFTDTPGVAQAGGSGPFPGDQAIYQLNLFADPNLKTKAGSVEFVCIYGFNKDGYCDVSFRLRGGDLIGTSDFSFTDTTFSVAVTGGSGKYEGTTGAMLESPSVNHSQRLVFSLK
jgi:hypothetical protein